MLSIDLPEILVAIVIVAAYHYIQQAKHLHVKYIAKQNENELMMLEMLRKLGDVEVSLDEYANDSLCFVEGCMDAFATKLEALSNKSDAATASTDDTINNKTVASEELKEAEIEFCTKMRKEDDNMQATDSMDDISKGSSIEMTKLNKDIGGKNCD